MSYSWYEIHKPREVFELNPYSYRVLLFLLDIGVTIFVFNNMQALIITENTHKRRIKYRFLIIKE